MITARDCRSTSSIVGLAVGIPTVILVIIIAAVVVLVILSFVLCKSRYTKNKDTDSKPIIEDPKPVDKQSFSVKTEPKSKHELTTLIKDENSKDPNLNPETKMNQNVKHDYDEISDLPQKYEPYLWEVHGNINEVKKKDSQDSKSSEEEGSQDANYNTNKIESSEDGGRSEADSSHDSERDEFQNNIVESYSSSEY